MLLAAVGVPLSWCRCAGIVMEGGWVLAQKRRLLETQPSSPTAPTPDHEHDQLSSYLPSTSN
jgi:hypothetical protein